MKIALCLSGYFSSKFSVKKIRNYYYTNGFLGYNYINKFLLNPFKPDIFIHSWDIKNQNFINLLYSKYIKASTFEAQKLFEEEVNDLTKLSLKYPDHPSSPFLMLSQAYGRKKSIELKKSFEKKNNFKYDCVIYARFDLGMRDIYMEKINRCTEIAFSKSLDMKYLYTKFWNQLNQGFSDMWIFSNSENMDIYSKYYDKILEYNNEDSKYSELLSTGWPDSSMESEFSNEIFFNKKTILKKYNKSWGFFNNHMLLKYFFIDFNLYDKCRFPIDLKRVNYSFKDLKKLDYINTSSSKIVII